VSGLKTGTEGFHRWPTLRDGVRERKRVRSLYSSKGKQKETMMAIGCNRPSVPAKRYGFSPMYVVLAIAAERSGTLETNCR
jgi:hypothetical protein